MSEAIISCPMCRGTGEQIRIIDDMFHGYEPCSTCAFIGSVVVDSDLLPRFDLTTLKKQA